MMDFGALPPEVNSSRMYAGPGSAPMMAAAAGWNALAAELSSAARAYESLVCQLTGDEWLGPASESMAAAVTPYVTWMEGTAGQAEQAATQARQAAAAYEAALAATVHPAQVTANRTQLMELVATNVIGQNTAAIAATEAQYGQMWAQDATAMYGYAAHSATAAQVTPFTPPAPVANPGGTATQGAVVAQVAGTSAGTSAQSTLARLISALPQTLQGLASPAASSYPGITPGPIGQYLFKLLGVDASNMNWLQADGAVFRTWIGPAYNTMGEPYFATGMGNTLLSLNKALAPPAPALPKEIIIPPAEKVSDIAGGLGGGAAGAPAAATLGAATPVGRLSVPAAWMAATPAAPPAAVTASPGITVSNAPAPGDSFAALPPMTGSAGVRGFGASPRYGFPIKVMATPPAAG